MNQLSATFQAPTSEIPAMTLTHKSHPQRQMKNDSPTSTLLPSILIVDDDPSVLEMLHAALDLWGFDVFLAKNGREGLNVLASQKIHGMLLDMDMPVMDGLTMLDELRCLGYPLPVVIMSGDVNRPTRRQLAKEGAQGFLDKPFSLVFLREVCATIFEKQEADGHFAYHFQVT